MGALDSGANAVIMWEFDFAGVRVDPYLHLIHCTYAIGSFASPLLMRYIPEPTLTRPHSGRSPASTS
jgi:hypothetical protein